MRDLSVSANSSPVPINHPIYPRFLIEVTEDSEILAVYHYGSPVIGLISET